jgi:hypothetical protein
MNMSNTPEFIDTAAIDVENEDDIPPVRAREQSAGFQIVSDLPKPQYLW